MTFLTRRFCTSKKPVLALGRRKGQELTFVDDDDSAGANIEVLALTLKNKNRFSIRHVNHECGIKEDEDDVQEKVKAPQHRRYLTYPSVGEGNPYQRERAFHRQQLDRAASIAHKYQLNQLGYVDEDVGYNQLSTHKGLAGIIENKISLAILKGEFENLKGTGKPLESYHNPFVDRTTDLAYSMLRKNGFKPEWIDLQQVMNSFKEYVRAKLRLEWASRWLSSSSPPAMLDAVDESAYRATMMVSLTRDEGICNEKVDAYNLVVPSHSLTRGRLSLQLEVESTLRRRFDSVDDIMKEIEAARRIIEKEQVIVASTRALKDRRRQDELRPNYNSSVIKRWSGSSDTKSIYQPRENNLGDKIIHIFIQPIDRLADYFMKSLSWS